MKVSPEAIPINRLKLNADKIQFIFLRTRQQLAKINCGSINVYGLDSPLSIQLSCLGVVVDSELKF